mgnify:FL=1
MTDTSVKRTDTRRRWLSSALLTVLLALGLIVTTLAISTKISVERNFTTGTVKLDLNGGVAVVDMTKTNQNNESNFSEPGFRIKRDFYLKNIGSAAAYYKLYAGYKDTPENNALANALDVEITYKDTGVLLFSGKLSALNLSSAPVADSSLDAGDTVWFTAVFRFSKDAGNDLQNKMLSFDLYARGTQVRNNPDKEFLNN